MFVLPGNILVGFQDDRDEIQDDYGHDEDIDISSEPVLRLEDIVGFLPDVIQLLACLKNRSRMCCELQYTF